ncbi:uncharacterized protein LOC127881413 [Dreissena polymorpha]|uniref:Cytochrome b5 heme-binding domain-containing protein n=1 Tax=Dreissena polymorpha TaxID=45954 RepID=A0A9D4GZC1_DREPO|nr:uncharacterized protein LOC127881413 [Dreissena polymorpha]XP_052285243.1 uncharacterized protein LOC127881413 [Dreissena polymorpha]KAH3825775.1 hypothetical protein DPMN_127655 [Dreissena polymorpha]
MMSRAILPLRSASCKWLLRQRSCNPFRCVSSGRGKGSSTTRNFTLLAAVTGVTGVSGYFLNKYFYNREPSPIPGTGDSPPLEAGACVTGFRSYPRAEVKNHVTEKSGVWITYKCGVYDVSNYLDGHVGGRKKILGTAGSDIGPCFDHIRAHKKENAIEALESMRIGNVQEVVEKST